MKCVKRSDQGVSLSECTCVTLVDNVKPDSDIPMQQVPESAQGEASGPTRGQDCIKGKIDGGFGLNADQARGTVPGPWPEPSESVNTFASVGADGR